LLAVPNPTTGEVRLRWTGYRLNGSARISITDESGHELKRYATAAMPADFTLPLAGYTSGTYFITLTVGNRSAVTRIVLQ
jgi:hypothetical protein